MSRFGIGFTVIEPKPGAKGEFLMLPYGQHETVDGENQFDFPPEDAPAVVASFKERGIKLLADWEHQSIAHLPGFEMFKSPDGKAPAAGWGDALEARSDGLWATGMQWTPAAVSALNDGSYRYFSPVLVLDRATKRVRSVQSLALTNEPRIKNIPALAARCDLGEYLMALERKEFIMPFKDELAGALAIKPDATDQEILAAVKRISEKAAAGDSAAGQITAFKTQAESAGVKVAELQGQVATIATDKNRLDVELVALKATHAGVVSAHDATKALLAEEIASRLEETGRITTAQKAGILEQARKSPEVILAAYKGIDVGAKVPVGTLGIKQAGENTAVAVGAGAAEGDHVSAYKATAGFNDERMKVHERAVAYVAAHPDPKLSPSEAYTRALQATTANA